jgi:hypothetical protein
MARYEATAVQSRAGSPARAFVNWELRTHHSNIVPYSIPSRETITDYLMLEAMAPVIEGAL